MSHNWNTSVLNDATHALNLLTELCGKRWLCRGQARRHNCLQPSIDRGRDHLSRIEKLKLERQSIDSFRSTARFFANKNEKMALNDDVTALMVMRHYGVPTRLLDWSLSPFVAASFACKDDGHDGEIWSFDQDRYVLKGTEQWKKWPLTTKDGSGDGHMFDAKITAFTMDDPPDWFICSFYPRGFPRHDAQSGLYSITARFDRNHDEAIEALLADARFFHLYLIPAKLKIELRRPLRELHGIWDGSLFPDSAGAADIARKLFP
jgi:hypothetical protein